MKVVIGAAIAAMFLAGAAFAQTETAPPQQPVAADSQCGVLTPEPALPDGVSTNNRDFNAGDAAYQNWGNAARTVLECRRAEIAQIEARLRGLLAEHNAGAARLNGLTEAWLAQRTAYCARDGIECHEAAP